MMRRLSADRRGARRATISPLVIGLGLAVVASVVLIGTLPDVAGPR